MDFSAYYFDEWNFKLLLKIAELNRHGRLGEVKLLCRTGHTAMLCNGQKNPKLMECVIHNIVLCLQY
jgi:hypothetical protein